MLARAACFAKAMTLTHDWLSPGEGQFFFQPDTNVLFHCWLHTLNMRESRIGQFYLHAMIDSDIECIHEVFDTAAQTESHDAFVNKVVTMLGYRGLEDEFVLKLLRWFRLFDERHPLRFESVDSMRVFLHGLSEICQRQFCRFQCQYSGYEILKQAVSLLG